MDDRRLETLARAFAVGAASRRRVVGRLVVGAGAGLATLLGLDSGRFEPAPAAAVGSGTCRAAQPRQFVSKNACRELRCGPTNACVCVQTIGHVPTCVANFDPNDRGDCPEGNECGEGRPCPNGFVCAKVMGCCGGNLRKCLRRCPG